MIDVYLWSSDGVERVDSPQPVDDGWVWVDVVGEGADAVRRLGADFNLDSDAVEDTLGETHLPTIEEYLDEVFVVLHGFNTGDSGRLETPETDVFIGARFLITIRDGERASIEAIKERIETEGNLPISTPAALLAFIALHAGRRYGNLIPEIERRADALEEVAIQGDPHTVVEVHALRRDVIYLRRALSPQFDVIEDLSESTHPAIDNEARRLFRRVAAQHRRALESLESGRALLGTILETYRGAVADQTNEIMRVLTVYSAILLPLSLIAGMWGMNFIRIPGAEATDGFWWLIGIMAVLAVGVWLYFARRGFIGAPRLRDLPKAVGVGLFTLGTAPIRVVAGGISKLGRTEDS